MCGWWKDEKKLKEKVGVAYSLCLTFRHQIHNMWSVKSFVSPQGSRRVASTQWKSVFCAAGPSTYSKSIRPQLPNLNPSHPPDSWRLIRCSDADMNTERRGLTEANKASHKHYGVTQRTISKHHMNVCPVCNLWWDVGRQITDSYSETWGGVTAGTLNLQGHNVSTKAYIYWRTLGKQQ